MAGKQYNIQPFLDWLDNWGWNTHKIRSHRQLAMQISVPYTTVLGWFRGQRPQMQQIGQVARATGHDAWELAIMADYPPEMAAQAKEFSQDILSLIAEDVRRDTSLKQHEQERVLSWLDAERRKLQARGHQVTPLTF